MSSEVFGIHPAQGLIEAYQKKYWQCQDPKNAQIIFLGLDANWDKNVENSSIYEEVSRYLNDGVTYWKNNGYHHPFLLPDYKKGDGYRFHANFVKTQITSQYADNISFIELLPIPTFGRSSMEPDLFYKMIDVNYLKNINDIIFDNRPKIVFITKTVYEKLNYIKKKMKLDDSFNFDMALPSGIKYSNRLMNIHCSNNVFVFVHTHFSASITNEHLRNIGNVAITFLEREKTKHWWEIKYSFLNSVNCDEEVRYLQASDVREVKEIVSENIKPLAIKDAFRYLEMKLIQNDEVNSYLIWS